MPSNLHEGDVTCDVILDIEMFRKPVSFLIWILNCYIS